MIKIESVFINGTPAEIQTAGYFYEYIQKSHMGLAMVCIILLLYTLTTGLVVSGKNCGSCNRSVPSKSAAGDFCPFCGAYWGSEETTEV
jgi:uncharacterized membrane protein YozB (DUF420 family)